MAFRIATNALSEEYTAVTYDVRSLDTVVELPPNVERPHVTTLPPLFTAANALEEE